MKKLLFIYNPHAGSGRIRAKLSDIVDVFSLHGYIPTVCPTRAAGDAINLTRALGDKFSRVVCSGGDGTLHEVVTGLMGFPEPPVVGYIPAGTTNDFSRNLNLSRDMILSAHAAVSSHTMLCDIGRFNGAPFVYVAAFGTLAEVSYDTPQQFKSLFGHLAYVLNGVSRIGALKPYHMRVIYDKGRVEGNFIFGMISNTRSVGGFKGWPEEDVKLDDGLFEVVLVREPTTPAEVQAILNAVVLQKIEGGPVIGFHTAHLAVECDGPAPWTLDGEFGGELDQVEITNCQRALSLCYRPR